LRGYKAKDLLKLKDCWNKLFQQSECYPIEWMFYEWVDDLMEGQESTRGKIAMLNEVIEFMKSLTFDIANELKAREQYYSKPREVPFDRWKGSKQRRREQAITIASAEYHTNDMEIINSALRHCGMDDLLVDDEGQTLAEFSDHYEFPSLGKVFKEDYALRQSNN
jgi:hypothetical protein